MAFGYEKWRSARLNALSAASEVVDTVRGPMEFACEGEAPFVLQFHGTPGGHDAGPSMGAAFTAAGLGVITLSRPGYLRTPLATGCAPAQQADAAAALLDALGIDRVAAHGVSGGGPSAVEFAARHPTRSAALLLTCAISDAFSATILGKYLITIYFSNGDDYLVPFVPLVSRRMAHDPHRRIGSPWPANGPGVPARTSGGERESWRPTMAMDSPMRRRPNSRWASTGNSQWSTLAGWW